MRKKGIQKFCLFLFWRKNEPYQPYIVEYKMNQFNLYGNEKKGYCWAAYLKIYFNKIQETKKVTVIFQKYRVVVLYISIFLTSIYFFYQTKMVRFYSNDTQSWRVIHIFETFSHPFNDICKTSVTKKIDENFLFYFSFDSWICINTLNENFWHYMTTLLCHFSIRYNHFDSK